MAYLEAKISIHAAQKAQIALLLAKKISVPKEYADFSDVFSKKSVAVFPKCSNINEHAIDQKPGKQSPYKPIYSLSPVELETLKTYIETNLANRLIWLFKSFARALILFVKKPDKNLCLSVNYHGLNNLTIKNWYPLSLIGELLDWLGKAKRFTQLDLISAYYRMRIKENDG